MMASADQRSDGGRVDFWRVIAEVIARRWWIFASALLFVFLFGTIAFTSTPIYRASAVLAPAGSERAGMGGVLGSAMGQLGGLASLAGINVGGGGSEVEEALAVLRSRQFTEDFINDKQLMPTLFPERWDKATGKWRADKPQPTPAKAYKRFSRIRTVTLDKKLGLVSLEVKWKDGNEAAAWANELIERLNAEMRLRATAKADASVGFLEKELNGTSVVETRSAINRLIEAQIRQRMLANVTQEYAFRVVDRAMAPDIDDPVAPRKALLIVVGTLLGLVIGVAGVLMRIAVSEIKASGARLRA